MRSPSSVTAWLQKEMLFPRLRRDACSSAISADLWSALPSEKARHDTPPPCCALGLSTRLISVVVLVVWNKGPSPSRSESWVSSWLLVRDVTASSFSSSLSCKYLVPAKGEATVCRGGANFCWAWFSFSPRGVDDLRPGLTPSELFRGEGLGLLS